MHTMGWKTWRHGDPHAQNYAVCSDDLARINMIYHFYASCYVEYSSINKMAKYDWNTFRNYVAFLARGVAPGTRRPHHDSELILCYHEAFRTWGHYHNNIVLFYHDSPITRWHFMDPTDRAIKGFYCILKMGVRTGAMKSLGRILLPETLFLTWPEKGFVCVHMIDCGNEASWIGVLWKASQYCCDSNYKD